MRSLVLLLFFCLITLAGYAQQEQFEAANQRYNEGAYTEAAQQYEALIEVGFHSPELHYNLGNSYYKQRAYGRAVLHYERALLLRPGDADIRHNLQEVQSRLKDDIEELPAFFLAEWWGGLRQAASVGAWSFLSILMIWLAVVGGYFWLNGKERQIRKYGFLAGLAFFLLSLLSFSLAFSQHQLNQDSGQAVVLEASIPLRSAPDAESTALLDLHEGTKVDILDQIGEWYKINLANGDQGWLPFSAVEKI
ncbi:MAG: tetratricopeptide repeat protein [Bacteroidota bacterium]